MDVVMIYRADLDDAIRQAALMGAEIALRKMPKNRPSQYNIKDAAEELGLHRNTISKMIKSGDIKLNACGKIPVEQIDKLLKSG